MATISEIKFKRSKTAGLKPAVASLKEGELAINLVDKKLFTKTGDKVEDLTLRSGGKVDGDLEITGKNKAGSLETGTITATDLTTTNITAGNGTFSNKLIVNADLTARNIKATSLLESGGDIKGRSSLRVRGQSSASAHLWFEGDEVTGENRNFERAVIYAPKQTPDNDGVLHFRVQAASNSDANTNARLFSMTGLGDFTVPGKITSFRVKTASIMVGGGANDNSGLGEGSLALGDNDTGFRNDGDGMFSVMANSRPLVHYNSSAAKFQIEHRKATRITHTDNANATILPANNTSLLEIDTSLDNNNAGGNGLTLLGYNSGGKYYHYFRGTGYVAYDMDQGVSINKGGLTVGGNSSFTNTLSAGGLITGGDVSFRNVSNRHLRFEYLKNDGTYAVDAYIYKDGVDNTNRRPGVRINCGTPNKTSGNTSNSGDFVFGEDGTFTLPGGGTINQDGINLNVYSMSVLKNTARGSKGYLRRFRGGSADTIWHETVQGGVYRLATGNTDAQEEFSVTSAGDVNIRHHINCGGSVNATGDVNASSEVLARGGSIRVRHSSNGTSHLWFQNASGIERGVIYAENASNTIKIRANRTSDATAQNSTAVFSSDGRFTPGSFISFDERYQMKAASDKKLKSEINDFDGVRSLENIEKMKFKTFEYLDSPGIERRGLIAQEAQLIDPEYVTEAATSVNSEDGEVTVSTHLALDTNPLLMDALAAIKVLSAQVKELQSKLTGQQ